MCLKEQLEAKGKAVTGRTTAHKLFVDIRLILGAVGELFTCGQGMWPSKPEPYWKFLLTQGVNLFLLMCLFYHFFQIVEIQKHLSYQPPLFAGAKVMRSCD